MKIQNSNKLLNKDVLTFKSNQNPSQGTCLSDELFRPLTNLVWDHGSDEFDGWRKIPKDNFYEGLETSKISPEEKHNLFMSRMAEDMAKRADIFSGRRKNDPYTIWSIKSPRGSENTVFEITNESEQQTVTFNSNTGQVKGYSYVEHPGESIWECETITDIESNDGSAINLPEDIEDKVQTQMRRFLTALGRGGLDEKKSRFYRTIPSLGVNVSTTLEEATIGYLSPGDPSAKFYSEQELNSLVGKQIRNEQIGESRNAIETPDNLKQAIATQKIDPLIQIIDSGINEQNLEIQETEAQRTKYINKVVPPVKVVGLNNLSNSSESDVRTAIAEQHPMLGELRQIKLS